MININGVSKSFGSCLAVDNVNLQVEKGESLALLGPNGAGKTTLVRMLLNFIRPDTGSISLNGSLVSNPASRRFIGYLAENHKIPPHLTGQEYLHRHGSLMGLSRKENEMETSRVLEEISMKKNAQRKARNYSKGMAQRVGLGAALLGKPQLLLLDEPISGLNPVGIRDVRRILERLEKDGVTVILNSHLLSEMEKTCRSVGIIHHGRLLVKDDIENIVGEDESLEDVFMKVIEQD